eukprot:gene14825-20877_t
MENVRSTRVEQGTSVVEFETQVSMHKSRSDQSWRESLMLITLHLIPVSRKGPRPRPRHLHGTHFELVARSMPVRLRSPE